MRNWENSAGIITCILKCRGMELQVEIDSDGDFTFDGFYSYIPMAELIEMVEKYKDEMGNKIGL